MSKGLFISIEGSDGAGKSTQITKIRQFLISRGIEAVFTREPGGTSIGEEIRKIILNPTNKLMSDMAEALLYAASRAQHVNQVISPALEDGKIVICDRFIDSSIAYQGFGRELGDKVRIINEYAVDGILPDLTIYLEISPQVSKARVRDAGELDRIEQEKIDFYQRVFDGYRKLQDIYSERFFVVDGSQSVETVAKIIENKLLDVLEDFFE